MEARELYITPSINVKKCVQQQCQKEGPRRFFSITLKVKARRARTGPASKTRAGPGLDMKARRPGRVSVRRRVAQG